MGSVTPEQVVDILKKENVHISLAQAEVILHFMVKLVRLTLTNIDKP